MAYEVTLNRYYNRYADNPQYTDYKKLLFRAGDALQSAEMNEVQEISHQEVTQLGKKFVVNGEVIDGGKIELSAVEAGLGGSGQQLYDYTVKAEESVIYLNTYFVSVAGTNLTLPDRDPATQDEVLGVQLTYTEVTESSDATLKDPAVETRNYAQPGAARLKMTGEWLMELDFIETANTEFIPLYRIVGGELVPLIERSPFEDAMISIVAKYDRNANGNYVVEGYEASYLSSDSNLGPFHVTLADGSANVYGYNYETDYSQDIEIPPLVDFELKQSEPVNFTGNGYYTARHTPVRAVFRISGQKETLNEAVTHGAYTGASDELLNQPVISVSSVSSLPDGGGTVYVEGTDWQLSGDSIAWLSVTEPAPGSTYYVTYRYQYTETDTGGFTGSNGAISSDLTSIYLEGFASGAVVSVDYDFTLQRTDSIYLDAKGKLGSIKGVPDENEPRDPSTDKDHTLKLATIQMGGDYTPIVRQDSQRVFKMADIQLLLDSIRANEYNISKLALAQNLKENQPTSIFRNTFVDDFEDDDLRDSGYTGTEQNAITVGGNLILDIDWENVNIDIDIPEEQDSIFIPSHQTTTVLQQPYWTKNRQINEYLFKAAPEARIEIRPKVYRWVSKTNYRTYVSSRQTGTVTTNTWTTRWRWWGWRRVASTTVTRQSLGTSVSRSQSISTSRKPEIIPQITLNIRSNPQAFDASENIQIFFADTLAKTATAVSGTLNTTFQIPAGQYSGNKKVHVKGVTSGVEGGTTFQATPLVRNIHTQITQWWRWVVQRRWTTWFRRDPVAQSFMIEETHAIDGIGVYFHTPPTSDTTVVICETTAGMPDKKKAIVSKTLTPAECQNTTSDTFFSFDTKPTLIKETEYAFIVICDDAVGRVKCARLGERDSEAGKWITSQAYSVGAMFNSSNNSAWTVLQEEDMKFYIKACEFDASYDYVMPVVNVTDASDLMVLANAKVEEGTSIQYKVDLLDRAENNTFLVNSYSQFPLDDLYTGQVRITAKFTSDGLRTPHLDPNVQLSVGTVAHQSIYTSRAFEFSNDATIADLYLDNYIPANTNIQAFYQNTTDGVNFTWVEIPSVESKPIGNDWVETHFRLEGLTAPSNEQSRIRLILTTSNDKDRPVCGNLRFTAQKI